MSFMNNEKNAFLVFSCFTEDFASAEATKGFPIALETFGALLHGKWKAREKNRFLVEGKGKSLPYFSHITEGFASVRRPKGFPIALWKPFGPSSTAIFLQKMTAL